MNRTLSFDMVMLDYITENTSKTFIINHFWLIAIYSALITVKNIKHDYDTPNNFCNHASSGSILNVKIPTWYIQILIKHHTFLW